MKKISTILLTLSLIGAMIGCKKAESSVTLSTVAQITSFAFTPNDSFPGLEEAVFIVDQLSDTGLIRMRKNDSVRFETPIDSIVPKISYYSTPSSVVVYLGDSAVMLTGYDTLDLSIKPIKIHVIAQDTKYDKWYKLDFDVHHVNGDLFLWDQLTPAISSQTTGEQHALMKGKTLYFFQNDGFRPRMWTSADMGVTWEEHTISGLPANCAVHSIREGLENVFYADGNTIYYSADGYTWQNIHTDVTIAALYMCFTEYMWLAARDEAGVMRLYTLDTALTLRTMLGTGLVGDSLPMEFPMSDFATIPFTSSSLHQHALIAGGYNRLGEMTDGRWSLEYNSIFDRYAIVNMASEKGSYPAFAGAAVSYYGKYMYLIGGIWEDRSFIEYAYTSIDEGMHWVAAGDTANSKKPQTFLGRYHASTFVDGDHIYIIGGEDNSTTYSDVYRGKQNSIAWPEIGN
ncbi:MAG: kelch motif-containing protein [Paludibacteraceae bacterium]|nr:kelch motif-containing protein [Paludibacteraceae bacterium]